jgi:hypothetical protein
VESLEKIGGLLEYRESGADMKAYVPCTEAEWPTWLENNIFNDMDEYDSTIDATPNSFCVHTALYAGDKFPLIYAIATTAWEAEDLVDEVMSNWGETHGY